MCVRIPLCTTVVHTQQHNIVPTIFVVTSIQTIIVALTLSVGGEGAGRTTAALHCVYCNSRPKLVAYIPRVVDYAYVINHQHEITSAAFYSFSFSFVPHITYFPSPPAIHPFTLLRLHQWRKPKWIGVDGSATQLETILTTSKSLPFGGHVMDCIQSSDARPSVGPSINSVFAPTRNPRKLGIGHTLARVTWPVEVEGQGHRVSWNPNINCAINYEWRTELPSWY